MLHNHDHHHKQESQVKPKGCKTDALNKKFIAKAKTVSFEQLKYVCMNVFMKGDDDGDGILTMQEAKHYCK